MISDMVFRSWALLTRRECMVEVILRQLSIGMLMRVRPKPDWAFDTYKLNEDNRLICYHGMYKDTGKLPEDVRVEMWTIVPQPLMVLLHIGTYSGVYKNAEFKFTKELNDL